MKCHYTHDPIAGEVFIPGCMGAAALGEHRCTCHSSTETQFQFEKAKYNEVVAKLREEIKDLESENKRLNKVIKSICDTKK